MKLVTDVNLPPEREKLYRAWAKLHAAGGQRIDIMQELGISEDDYAKAYQWARSHGLLVRRKSEPHVQVDMKPLHEPPYRARQLQDWPDLPADAFK